MKTEVDNKVYQLSWDIDHFSDLKLDWDKDIYFHNDQDYAGYEFFETAPLSYSAPLIYMGDIGTVRRIDYPYPDNYWSVMSLRMLEALRSVSDFPHRAIPVKIFDAQQNVDDCLDAKGSFRNEVLLENYVAVQLTEYLDVFDYEKSEYIIDEEEKEEPDRFIDISKFMFKTPPGGFPPIFRIKERSFYLFISGQAREALKDQQITGPRYLTLDGVSASAPDEVDVIIRLS